MIPLTEPNRAPIAAPIAAAPLKKKNERLPQTHRPRSGSYSSLSWLMFTR
jgi:hypothetical protein